MFLEIHKILSFMIQSRYIEIQIIMLSIIYVIFKINKPVKVAEMLRSCQERVLALPNHLTGAPPTS